MRISRNRLIAMATGLFLFVLLANAPARIVGYVLADSGVVASGYSGTLWRGQMKSLVVPVSGQQLQLGAVDWRLSPWSLLLLNANTQFHTSWGRQKVSAELSLSPWRDMVLRDLELTVSARLVRLFLPVELRGMARLTAEQLELSQQGLEGGAGRLVWERARWVGNRNRQALGSYVLEFTVNGSNQVRGQVSSLVGPVIVEGDVELRGSEYDVDLKIRSEEGLSSELRSALELMAAATHSGYHVKFSSVF
jgi:general secretion pathway protein N